MKSPLAYGGSAVLALVLVLASARNATSAGQGTALVRLQATTPGVDQTGHSNITGTSKAGSFRGGSAILDTSSVSVTTRSLNSAPVFEAAAFWGDATNTTVQNYGGLFRSAGANGIGCVGLATSLTGSPNGGYFRSDAPEGNGVFGIATATAGNAWGGFFISASSDGIGVYGEATTLDGFTWGGKFVNHTDGGAGVYGSSDAEFGTGGYFQSPFIGVNANGKIGVGGSSTVASGNGGLFTAFGTGGIGVWGRARGSTGLNYGVYGDTLSPTGWAGYFEGGKGVFAEKLSVGSSALVTNLNADLLDGQNSAYYNNAANLTGTIADARLSNNVALLNAIQTFTAANTFGAGIDVNARTTTNDFTMQTGGAANTVLLGAAGGVGSWGTVGSARLTSDSASLSKVTNGNFSISSGDLSTDIANRIVLADGATTKVSLVPNTTIGGIVNTYGPNGNINIKLTNLNGYYNNGYLNVSDSSGDGRVGMYISSAGQGLLFSDVKSFLVPDPADPRFNIMYACVEGPEAAMYTRGTGQLVNGRAVIDLPDHFLKLANMQTLTIQVTPLDECEGLFCKKLNGEIVVKELRKGQSNIEFDWEVKAVRKGFEDWAPVRPWDDALPEGDQKQMWDARLRSIAMRKGQNRP